MVATVRWHLYKWVHSRTKGTVLDKWPRINRAPSWNWKNLIKKDATVENQPETNDQNA